MFSVLLKHHLIRKSEDAYSDYEERTSHEGGSSEVIDFLATTPSNHYYTNETPVDITPPTKLDTNDSRERLVQLQSQSQQTQRKSYNSKAHNKEEGSRVYIHDLDEDPNQGCISYNSQAGPPRNAFAALLEVQMTEEDSAVQMNTIDSALSFEHEDSVDGVFSKKSTYKQKPQEKIASRRKIFDDKIEKIKSKIQIDVNFGQVIYEGKTIDQLQIEREKEGHNWSNTQKRIFTRLLSLMKERIEEVGAAHIRGQGALELETPKSREIKKEAIVYPQIDPDLMNVKAGFMSRSV